jgi:RNA polymerase sigma-70 factor (ECF subfamily)
MSRNRRPHNEKHMQTAPAATHLGQVPESEIIGRIAAGDRTAFAWLMRRYNQKLYRTARSILRDDAEAEDAVQETYLIAYRSLPGFRGDATLSTWLVRIVANESLGRLRKRKRDAEIIHLGRGDDDDGTALEVTMDDAPFEQPERAAVRAETRRLLEAKIDLLPEAFRTVFMLRAVEEMSVEETAAALGIPEPTVRSRFFRAKALLRAALAHEIDVAEQDAFAFDGARCDRIVANVLARLDALPAPDA